MFIYFLGTDILSLEKGLLFKYIAFAWGIPTMSITSVHNTPNGNIKVTRKSIEEFQKAQEKSESEACEMAQKFLEDHGLPMDVTDEWQPGDVLDIVQVISGQKKI